MGGFFNQWQGVWSVKVPAMKAGGEKAVNLAKNTFILVNLIIV